MDSTPASNGAPLIDVAFARMKTSIIRCELEPGTRLKVESLSKIYGLSSSPIREALNRLAQDGIVQATENRGFWVAPISIDDFKDITRLRILLEHEALMDSIEHGDDDWEVAVLTAFHRLSLAEKRMGTGPVALDDDWSERHRAYHMALLSATPSPLLLNMVGSLFDRAERYRRYSALHRTEERHKGAEHEALMKAAIGREKDKAAKLLRKHIEGTLTRVAAALERQLASVQ
ncbi:MULTISPECIES: GntR family transcriptional regulator [Burkholderia]|uniref:GntR family transcriptional regulator n=1 Tax=Burkholderia TaxID=32008 RepID=UPI000679DC62|nr:MULTISPECIES: GntR family transcriptional regulator [Burkholderia]KWU25138.1 GntR family transcriptional regulator [Burkholderia cenocepacia]QVN11196.1 GntR family transcriptional regulator [Burkholderia sp. LAS2]RQS24709.1 GntR family transcriptional regulator [Burkholderia sp. Bp8998]RQU42223.1 GntR family transcriptional regulator [Burkholderia cenocepacia]RQU95966.1 GntR family transcriptional regulator [Burkholderia cenocepacia]